MKIYTKTGDKGKTSLIGGTRVPKHHQRIEAYGTIDELMAYIGLLNDEFTESGLKTVMLEIQDRLMTCASILAADCEDCEVKIPEIIPEDIEFLEQLIDAYDKELEPLRVFILPGGHVIASHCHIARTVCRRAERIVTHLAENMYVPEHVIQYLNRLSDYLFTLSRKILKDFNIDEIRWRPRL
ncbi:MAG TPA: cob(I)yrinic acid a,c-diamide adenosyltransferase [Bacteroidales bacterium]|nr:cob(I)yrinic acid a,c-diamide adenosyltransferase [Bacteroidales bacterium]